MGFKNTLSGEQKNSAAKANCKTNIPNENDLSRVLEQSEEFSTDIHPELQNEDIINCSNNGVVLHYIPNMIKLSYTGILAQNNSGNIYAVIGYGDNDNWEDITYYLMHKTQNQTYELLTFRKRDGNVNIAFKDESGNWDNNSGRNYVFYDQSGQGRH